MRNVVLVALFGVFVAHTAHAQALDPNKPVKVGYVDLSRCLNEVEDGKAAKAKLKIEFDAKQKKLDQMQNELKTKKDEFEKRAAVMKPDARAQKQDELQREFMQLQQTYMQLQRELMDSEGQLTQDIGGKIKQVVESIGDRDGYTMILNIADNVLYHKRHMDLTDDVVREYNQKHAKK